jgi:hypothetical protein
VVGPSRLSNSLRSQFQANAGDSRSVLGVKGRAKPLSFDHKPQNEGLPILYMSLKDLYLTQAQARRLESVPLEVSSILVVSMAT